MPAGYVFDAGDIIWLRFDPQADYEQGGGEGWHPSRLSC
jgi:hypothetical protein